MAAGDYIKAMSVELSQRASDEVAAYNTSGSLYTSAQRLQALNEARESIYNNLLKTMGMDEFKKSYPEFLVETDRSTAVTNNVGTRFAGARHFVTMKLLRTTTNEGTYTCRRIPASQFNEMETDPEACPFNTSATDYGFIEYAGGYKFYGEKAGDIDGTYYGLYLKDHVNVAYTEDPVDPVLWRDETLREAVGILKQYETKR